MSAHSDGRCLPNRRGGSGPPRLSSGIVEVILAGGWLGFVRGRRFPSRGRSRHLPDYPCPERVDRTTMSTDYVLSAYIDGALDRAEYEKLDGDSYSGFISVCPGVIAFANSLRDCERELRSVLEDWLLLGLKLGHHLPVIGGIDLNKDMTHAEMESV